MAARVTPGSILVRPVQGPRWRLRLNKHSGIGK
jgi:hypothetical protein